MDNKLLVSVITVCLNSVNRIEHTIKSVINQNYNNIEYIIIDGLSTDGTMDVIDKYRNNIAYCVSEKDNGIADAFNKGFLASKGSWITYLNAGDFYCDTQVIDDLLAYIGKYDIIYGGLKTARKKDNTPNYYYAEDVSGDMYWLRNAIPHQSCIVSRHVFNKIGLFDKHMKYAMDYEHFLRAYKQGFKFKAIGKVMTNIDNGGVSAKFWKNQLTEFMLAQKRHNILPLLRPFYYCERFLRTYMYHKLGYF